MKKFFSKTNLLYFLFLAIFMGQSIMLLAQDDPSVPNTDGSGGVVGGNAAISSGMFLMVGLAAIYGGYQLYRIKSKESDKSSV